MERNPAGQPEHKTANRDLPPTEKIDLVEEPSRSLNRAVFVISPSSKERTALVRARTLGGLPVNGYLSFLHSSLKPRRTSL
jgi:hypothetical protein